MVSKDKRSTNPERNRTRHGGRVVLSLDVEPQVRDALRGRAASAGVSMAEYVSSALAEPERAYVTASLEIAQPLAQISYRLAQIAQALGRGDIHAAVVDLDETKLIVAEAMIPLRRRHGAEVRANDPRRGGGWTAK